MGPKRANKLNKEESDDIEVTSVDRKAAKRREHSRAVDGADEDKKNDSVANLPVKKRKITVAASDTTSDSECEDTTEGDELRSPQDNSLSYPLPININQSNESLEQSANYADSGIDIQVYTKAESAARENIRPPAMVDVSKCNMHEHRWEKMYDLLLQTEATYGSCKIPLSYEVTGPDGNVVKLGLWLGTQRQMYRKNQLRKDKLDRLQALVDAGKMEWGEVKVLSDDARWNAMFDCLISYCQQHGHCNVPERHVVVVDGETVKLGRWLDRQRGHIKRNKIRPDRMVKLQALIDQGLLIQDTLEEDEKKWNWCYEALAAYGLEHGNCNVPHSYVIKLPNGSMSKLGVWLSTQRHLQKKPGKLRSDRAMRLQELVDKGMLKWGDIQIGKDQKWDLCFAALLQYDAEHGNTDVSRAYESILPDGSRVKLHKWLNKQISTHKEGKLKHDRYLRMQELVSQGKLSWELRLDTPWLDHTPRMLLDATQRQVGSKQLHTSLILDGGKRVRTADDSSDSEIEELDEDQVDALMHVASSTDVV